MGASGRSNEKNLTILLEVGLEHNLPLVKVLSEKKALKRAWTSDDATKSFDVPRRQVTTLFKALEEQGFGRFIVGRRTQPSRFEWAIDIAQVVKASTAGPTSAVEKLATSARLSRRFDLAGGRWGELSVPEDLSDNEFEEILVWLKLSKKNFVK